MSKFNLEKEYVLDNYGKKIGRNKKTFIYHRKILSQEEKFEKWKKAKMGIFLHHNFFTFLGIPDESKKEKFLHYHYDQLKKARNGTLNRISLTDNMIYDPIIIGHINDIEDQLNGEQPSEEG